MFRFWFQFVIASIFLFISAFAAFYEGSALADEPWEWKYSTPFSHFFNDEVNGTSLSQLDYLIYSVKFQPAFPVIMAISSLYIIILIGYHFLKTQHKWFACYLSFLSGGLFLLSYLFYSSSAIGGQVFFYIWFVSGALCGGSAVMIYFQALNRRTNKMIH